VDSLEDLTAQIGEMNRVLKCMGCSLENPIFTIGFLTFSALPWLRLTPKGLWDVKKGRIVWPPSDG
jgi:adenine deaminase